VHLPSFVFFHSYIRKVKVNNEWLLEPMIDKQKELLKDIGINSLRGKLQFKRMATVTAINQPLTNDLRHYPARLHKFYAVHHSLFMIDLYLSLSLRYAFYQEQGQ
jgi:hypothetical protein